MYPGPIPAAPLRTTKNFAHTTHVTGSTPKCIFFYKATILTFFFKFNAHADFKFTRALVPEGADFALTRALVRAQH